ncbi:AraC family transcriptional regulator [Myroides sp. LJL119]
MSDIIVLNLDDLAKDFLGAGFYADTIPAHLVTNHAHIEKPHKHNFYVCVIFTKGSGVHEIDFTKYEIQPGSVFMLAPGQTHSWTLSNDIDGYIFFHTQDFMDMFYSRQSIREYPVFSSLFGSCMILCDQNQTNELVHLFTSMIKEVSNRQYKDQLMIVNLLSIFYITTNRIVLQGNDYKEASNSVYYNHFIEFENLLEKYFRKFKFAAQYAQQMNMTQKHLNRICRNLINKTTTDLILERLILEAKRELIHCEKGLSEIASDLGYEDYSYFSKVFKKQVGLTPKEFQKKHQE